MNAALAIKLEHHLALMLMVIALVSIKLAMVMIKDKARSVHELTVKVYQLQGGK